MAVNSVLVDSESEVILSKDEYTRLLECETLLWEVERSLPSGLESWIDDEVLETLRGE